jgi:hypothetical protein
LPRRVPPKAGGEVLLECQALGTVEKPETGVPVWAVFPKI